MIRSPNVKVSITKKIEKPGRKIGQSRLRVRTKTAPQNSYGKRPHTIRSFSLWEKVRMRVFAITFALTLALILTPLQIDIMEIMFM
jgi:hypothetical protein